MPCRRHSLRFPCRILTRSLPQGQGFQRSAALGLAATAFNVTQVVDLSRRDTQLLMQAARDEARATDFSQQAGRMRATVDPRVLDAASADARQANDLIDRRTFSWTELLNRLETANANAASTSPPAGQAPSVGSAQVS